MPNVNRLTVDGRDYFLPDPIEALRGEILDAIRAGGGYVTIPPLRGGPGIEVLFSPGMPVTWTAIEVPATSDVTNAADDDPGVHDVDYDDI